LFGLLNEPHLESLLIVHGLQRIVELKQEHNVLEMLHEFWVINLAVSRNISQKVEGVAFRDGEA
jgi:hypothetical protein